jgi:chromosomal replication initiation ATPase DnaA
LTTVPSGRQLPLEFGQAPQFGRDNFLVSRCNERALALIEEWPNWPSRAQLLIGPPGSGKSHLAAIFAARANAAMLSSGAISRANLVALAAEKAVVVEDADRIDRGYEASLFHLFNLVQEAGSSLLVTARSKPETWGLRTADLLSRLRLCPTVELSAPDEALLEAVIVKLFLDRQLIVEAAIVTYIALHIERSFDAARRIVDLVDHEALARGVPITKSLVRTLVQALPDEGSNGGR